MSDSDATVTAAVIAAVASLMVALLSAIFSFLGQKRITRLEAELSERTAQKNARLEYEFEARKRLYQECEPLLFELSEFAERALGRIVGLARTAADGDLDPGPKSWLRRGYYQRSTYYRLMVPLAALKLVRSKLTKLDLALDESIRWQYALCKLLADTFTDDFELAKVDPILAYDPHKSSSESTETSDSAVYWQQGVPRGILENATNSLIVDQPGAPSRVMSFSEFELRMSAREEPLTGTFKRIDYLFQDFHPCRRPVLWRILLAQAHIYHLLLVAHDGIKRDIPEGDEWRELRSQFDWREKGHSTDDAQIELSIQAAATYVQARTVPALKKVMGVRRM